jgi:hypothetical protein
MTMQPTDVYREIISQIKDDDIRKAAQIMAWHVGHDNSITLDNLAMTIFDKVTDTSKRQTRDILETLTTEYLLPVCSDSGKAGRWLAKDNQERDEAAKELENRAHSTLDRARALRQAKTPTNVYATMLARASMEDVQQMSFL